MFISQSSLLKSLCLFCCLSITSLFTAATHSWTATNTNTTDFNWYSNYFRVTVSNIYLKKYADPPWYNDNWQYREVVAISNRAPTNISNYQARILLNLPAGKYETDLDDLRVCGSAGTNLLTFYAEDHSDNSTNAIIWAKLPYMPANTETRVYIYHGNPAAPRADDYYATFSYDTEQPVYHVLFADGRNDFSISSLVSNNTVNSSAYSYGQLKNNQSVGALGTSVSVLGPVSSKPDQDDTEGLSPVSWASTNFAFKGFRDGSGFRIKALYDSTTVSFYKNNNSSAWNTRMLNAGEYEYESGGSLGSSDTAVIISDKPVLAVFDTSGSRDSAILTPGNREILGTPTSSGYVTALYDNTEVVEYRSDSDTPVTNTLAQRGDYFSPGGSADQGSGAAVLIRADLPVAVNSQADMDGNESVSWLCQKNISAEYIIPVASEYIAIVCPYEDTQIDIIESGIPINSANSGTHWHSGPITHPGKIYFSGNFNANVRIKGDKPFYMFYEYRSKDDETQAFGVNDSRKYIFPEPEITAVTNEIIGSGVPPTLPWVKPAAQLSTYDISYWSNFQAGGLRTNGGYINFQLSTNNGSQWLYHDGSQWTDTGGNLSNNNTITSINNNLPDTSLINTTGLTWRALFYSDGTNNLGFHRINIDYERSQTLCLLPNISSLSFYQTNSFIWSNHPDLSSYLVIAEDPGFTITNTVIS
ncbi:MAG TPA: DUF2341 domain-containing protein, partial [Spirochaetota bacterium]|nr:DUF2341 domain-containing protein [Spirochaetota bacterium]